VNRRTPFFFVLSFTVVIFLISCTGRAAKLPFYGHVPPFTMTDSNGKTFDSKELEGKAWVVDFIYTQCPGPCPRMTSQMHKIQQQVSGQADVRLISISVDPDHDSPPVLNAFAHRFGGPTSQWFFLTGPGATIHQLAHDVFKVGDLIGVMDHSTRFMLVDRRGNIRGYYSTFDTDGIPALVRDLLVLQKG
jgi:protein SCO1/2